MQFAAGGQERCPEKSPDQVERVREAGKADAAEAPLRMMEPQFRHGLNRQPVGRPDGPEETERTHVSGDQDMLAVVDNVSGSGIGKRIGTPAGGGALFEDNDRNIARGKADPG
jgi:hypothetical protein